MTKTCSSCGESKPLGEFYKEPRYLHGVMSACKLCKRKRARVVGEQNREKYRDGVDAGTEKQCSGCARSLTLQHFPRNPTQKFGVANYCKNCAAEAKRSAVYGLSPEQFNSMMASQLRRCAICTKEFSQGGLSPCVDHDHRSGKVRGLLCHKCNTAIGLLGDNPSTAIRAANYLGVSQ